MNARYPTILLALACIACQPADIINIYYGDTGDTSEESTGEPEPDLPPAETETSTETGDGDGDTETSGDGDGDGDPGDGDGDSGDGDGEPSPGGLVVESAGEPIGHLIGVWDFGYIVWDEVSDITFRISAQTGHVARDIPLLQSVVHYWYETGDCTGQRFQETKFKENNFGCPALGPLTRPIIVDGGSMIGDAAALGLQITTGTQNNIGANSFMNGLGMCVSNTSLVCSYPVYPTEIIPVTFPLPITVTESMEP
jgi:hypothetical protein